MDRPSRSGPSPTEPALAAGVTRVVFCTDNLGIGGTELNAVRTAERLSRDRFSVSVVLLGGDGPLRSRYEAAGIEIVEFPIDNLYGKSALRQGRRLVQYLRREGAQIVHSHDVYSNVFGTACARAARVPGVIASRRWWHTLPAAQLRIANRLAFRGANKVVANSTAVAQSAQHDDGVPAAKIAVITNFVEDAAFDVPPDSAIAGARAALGLPRDAIVIGILARLDAVKDHGTLLRGLARLGPRWPRAHCLIVGDGPERANLEELTDALGLRQQVTFAGERPNRPNPHLLFDISVLCSLSEGFPNSVVEAMAAGRPVVATEVGGVRDAVEHGRTGWLVGPADPAALGDALERIMMDPSSGAVMGAAGRQRAQTLFEANTVIGKLEALYTGLVRA